MNSDQIDAVAREIRKYYIERKNAIYQNRFKLVGKNAEFIHWQRAAEVCLELNATPEVFIDAAFANCKNSVGPFPNAMYGPAVRGWYKEYTASRYKYKEAKQNAIDAGHDPVFDVDSNNFADDLRGEINLVRRSLIRLTGTSEINAQTIEYIRSLATSFPAHIRVLIGYKDAEIKSLFGKEAYEFYTNKPYYFRAAESLGFPIRDILLWLNAPQN